MYTIDGVPLSDPKRRWSVHRESQRRTPVAFRSVDVDVPGVDGNIPIYGEQVEATALALEVNVYGTPDQIEERVNFLRSLLGRTSGPLEVERRGGLVADAKPASISDPVMTDHYARISVTLSIPSGVWRGPSKTWAHPDALSTDAEGVGTLDGGSATHHGCARAHHRASHDAASRGCRDRLEAQIYGLRPGGAEAPHRHQQMAGHPRRERVLGIDRDERHSQHRRHRSTLRHHTIPTYADTWAQPGRRSHHRALRQVHGHRHHVGHGGPDSGTHITLVGEHLGLPLRRIRPPDWR